MDTYYIDREFVTEDTAVISAKDLAVLRGFGVFDFLITYNKRPFYLKEHVQRLENSAEKIGLTLNHTDEAIYVDRNDCMLEGTTTNFYFFEDNKLITTQSDILPGITRSVVLELVKGHFDVEFRDIDKDEIGSMEEVFISASNKEIVPIIRINDTVIGDGKPGTNTRKVAQLFKDYTTAYGQGKV